MSSLHKKLFLANRNLLKNNVPIDTALLSFERDWISNVISKTLTPQQPNDLPSLRLMLKQVIEYDEQNEPESSVYVANTMSRDEFKILVQEFAMDGLTEAQIFYYLMPKLSLEAQMPMLRMLIDEFGSGNLKRSHTTLYCNLLTELNMPIDLTYYIEENSDPSFEFVNMYLWLAMRAENPSYFAGVITYFETVIPFFFTCYTTACERLGIKAHHYYTEHVHIDVFHAIEGQRLLKAMSDSGELDASKAWQGVCLGREITNGAFEAAVDKARRLKAKSFYLAEA
nr:iron-containing redox enzyme family protein [Pseudomonas luteola]